MTEFNKPATQTAVTTLDISIAELTGANNGQRKDLLKEQYIFRTPDGRLYSLQDGQLKAANNLTAVYDTDPTTGQAVGLVDPVGGGTIGLNAPQLRRSASLGGSQQVTQSVCWQQLQLSNGTDLSTTYRMGVVFPNRTADIKLVFGNCSTGAVTQAGSGNPITVTAGFEYNGVTHQVTFNGQTSVTIPNNKQVVSDVIPIDVPAGATVYIRSCPTVTSTQKWNRGILGWSTCSVSAINSDLTTGTGQLATLLSGQSFENRLYGPLAILGTTPTKTSASVCIVGDSIAAGTGDGTPTRIVAGRGFAIRGLGFTGVWSQQSIPSSKVVDRALQTNQPAFSSIYSNNDYALCNMGTNDLAEGTVLATIQAALISVWGNFFNRGIPIYQCTILPKTTSTDRWATTTNQTFTSGAENTARITLNTWIRAGAPIDTSWNPVAVGTAGAILAGSSSHPLTGYIETANIVEVNSSNVLTQNGGYWKTNGVSDSGTFTSWSNSPYTATDTAKTWVVNEHAGKSLYITGGTGAGASAGIVSNTVNGLVLNSISTVPDATSTYQIVDSMTFEGIHPSINGHIALSAPVSAWASAKVVGR